MMKGKLTLLFILLSITLKPAIAQQETQFTQYMFNGLVLNPAYAGSKDVMNITGAWRNQWAGIEGNPQTQTLSIHAPTGNNRLALGALVINDKISIHRYFRLFGMAAYRIPVKNGMVSMGLQFGVLSQRSDFQQLITQQPGDPNFQANYSEILPEFGAGIYYYTDRFHIGFSVPKITGDLFSNDPRSLQNERHFYLHTGYVIGVSEILQLHPSVLVKSVGGAAIAYDINLNAVINDVLWIGTSVRSFNSINALLQVQLSQQFRFGWSYDTQYSGFSQITNGTHEIMLNYFFKYRKEKVVSPRIF